jgi:hypothetical protein
MSKGVASQLPGQVQPVDDEGAMNGFTAVNARASPGSQPAKHVSMQPVRDGMSSGAHENHGRSILSLEQLHDHTHTNGASDHAMISSSNGVLKRKRSVVKVDDDHSSGDSSRSSGSPPTASPDVHMQDSSAFPQVGAEQREHSGNGHTQDEQAEHLCMLAPIQHGNQQQRSNGNFTPVTSLQNGQSLHPGYHKGESKGLITTNAGVQMDPKKRKRVGSLTISLHNWSSEIY